jgi:hypothetical protein
MNAEEVKGKDAIMTVTKTARMIWLIMMVQYIGIIKTYPSKCPVVCVFILEVYFQIRAIID